MVRSAGTLTAATILLFALIIAVVGGLNTRRAVNSSFAEQSAIGTAQLALEHMLRIQLDEQNYIRAYVITKDPSDIDSYRVTASTFGAAHAELERVLEQEHLTDALAALRGYDSAHERWQSQVAEPLLNRPQLDAATLEIVSKNLVGIESDAAHFIEARMELKNREVLDATQGRINETIFQGIAALIIFGFLSILFFGWRSRLNAALESERVTTQTLQRAFRSEHVPLPNCEIGSAYGAANAEFAVGGDVFDVHRLSDRLGLILIADVSGKGVDAAVLTAFIKFTIRGIALRRRDPGFILQEFNRAFRSTVDNPNIFVSMFVGILDTWSMRLDYASGGHEIAFVRRAASVEQLAVTGPILGVMEEPFEARTVYLEHGDTIVLSTDGLTESRDAKGVLLEASGAMEWIRSAPEAPTELARSLIERARARTRATMRDDCAVLAIRIARPSEIEAPQPSPQVQTHV
ncbi:MAG TPA: PP2C family protein-serine/threonine phosphatase [Candidatus Baltobacteraceae bacterium]|nr:PP2C family protein-serine/threonine phosphatase [Candidatus Baltobacteraceae bacterium]